MKDGFRFLSVVNDAAEFNERLFRCLRLMSRDKRRPSSFDLNEALVNLAANLPDSSMQSLKSKLDEAFSASNGTSNERLYALFCLSLIKRPSQQGDCIKDLRRLVACALSQNSTMRAAHQTLSVKPWLAAISDLSDCRVSANADKSAVVRCNFKHPPPMTGPRQVRYIYESILDQRISKRSVLHQVADEVGAALARSRWGSRFAHEASKYFAIYKEGRRKLRALSKIANKAATARLTMLCD